MNIEGTPHEKWLLVTFSYIIGFTTAFIAFNHAFSGSVSTPLVAVQPSSQTASVPAAPQPAAEAVVADVDETVLVYENQGLYVYTNAEHPTLLSKDIAAINGTYDDMPSLSERQGFHTAVPGYQYFAADNVVYYCEQYDTDTCVPMFYNVATSELYVVQDASGPVQIPATVANQVSFNATTGLSVAGYTSINPSQPWLVSN